MAQALEIGPEEAQASLIWLHGLGADGHDFAWLPEQLALPPRLALRYLLPHAPVRPVTANGGLHMPAWYDILGWPTPAPEDAPGLAAATQSVHALIAAERARLPDARRILLGGFSQGGALALHAGLRAPEALLGIAALSTYLPLAAELSRDGHAANRRTPVFMAHGQFDEVIPQAHGERSREHLRAAGYAVDWHSYPAAHTLCEAELADLRDWIVLRLTEGAA